jgi:hypothetical protein
MEYNELPNEIKYLEKGCAIVSLFLAHNLLNKNKCVQSIINELRFKNMGTSLYLINKYIHRNFYFRRIMRNDLKSFLFRRNEKAIYLIVTSDHMDVYKQLHPSGLACQIADIIDFKEVILIYELTKSK